MKTKILSFFDYFTEEIQENAPGPSIVVVILLIYQLTKNMDGLQREK